MAADLLAIDTPDGNWGVLSLPHEHGPRSAMLRFARSGATGRERRKGSGQRSKFLKDCIKPTLKAPWP
jgi:hypothetical protein